MADRVIDRRKSQLFLHNLSPVTDTHDEIVRKKLTCGKFPLTKTGIIKMVGLMILMGSIISFLTTENTCTNKDYSKVFVSSAAIAALGELMILMGSIISFLTTENTCTNKDYSKVFIGSAAIAALGELVLFLVFSFGLAIKKPGMWIRMDLFFNLLVSLLTLVSAALSLKLCRGKSSELASQVSEALGICGSAIILFISCPALFLMYRFVEYLDPMDPRIKNGEDTRPRKSFFFRKSVFV